MTITRSICFSLALAAGAFGCNTKRERDPDVPGTNAGAPRVIEAEDPETHRPLTTKDSPSSSNPDNDYNDTKGVPGDRPAAGSPANTASVASGATAAAVAGDPAGNDPTPMATDAGVLDAPAMRGKPGAGSGSGSGSAAK